MNFKLYLKKPSLLAKGLFQKAVRCGLTNWMPDAMYLKLRYKHLMEKKLDLKHPKTFNEKLQWLKLYYRDNQQTVLVDKYLVKDYVANVIGDEYIIPTLGHWKRAEDIDFDSLPEQFVLKCNHDSGGIVICKNKKHRRDCKRGFHTFASQCDKNRRGGHLYKHEEKRAHLCFEPTSAQRFSEHHLEI